MLPKHPLYIVSKGRADTRMTSRALEAMGVPYYIVVERQERDAYAAVIDPKKVLVLDPKFQDEYNTLDNLGASKPKGAGPARNFAWQHAIDSGATWHWVMDDNIWQFYRLNQNRKIPARTGAIFRAMEDFCERYTNVLTAGPQYYMFLPQKQKLKPFVTNTRIYSCSLLRNDGPFRWRGRYNEDTDLSLQILKAGYCTIQFNAFLQFKATTQTVKGGNTTDFYEKEGTSMKTKMLVDVHPDVATVVRRFGRVHHHVDYRPFRRNKLIRRPDLVLDDKPNEYGMRLVMNPGE